MYYMCFDFALNFIQLTDAQAKIPKKPTFWTRLCTPILARSKKP